MTIRIESDRSSDRLQRRLRSAPMALPTSLIPTAARMVDLGRIVAQTVLRIQIVALIMEKDRTAAPTAELGNIVALMERRILTAALMAHEDLIAAPTAALENIVAQTARIIPIAAFRKLLTIQHRQLRDQLNRRQ